MNGDYTVYSINEVRLRFEGRGHSFVFLIPLVCELYRWFILWVGRLLKEVRSYCASIDSLGGTTQLITQWFILSLAICLVCMGLLAFQCRGVTVEKINKGTQLCWTWYLATAQ